MSYSLPFYFQKVRLKFNTANLTKVISYSFFEGISPKCLKKHSVNTTHKIESLRKPFIRNLFEYFCSIIFFWGNVNRPEIIRLIIEIGIGGWLLWKINLTNNFTENVFIRLINVRKFTNPESLVKNRPFNPWRRKTSSVLAHKIETFHLFYFPELEIDETLPLNLLWEDFS